MGQYKVKTNNVIFEIKIAINVIKINLKDNWYNYFIGTYIMCNYCIQLLSKQDSFSSNNNNYPWWW